jgi:hypothetical protein
MATSSPPRTLPTTAKAKVSAKAKAKAKAAVSKGYGKGFGKGFGKGKGNDIGKGSLWCWHYLLDLFFFWSCCSALRQGWTPRQLVVC